jgi:phosphatidylserine/phosphatidylglycerophosphate/cardiolipin synthase-like enzyme
MKKQFNKSLKLPPSSIYAFLVLISFSAGYTCHDLIQSTQQPITTEQQSQPPLQRSDPHIPKVCFTPNKACQIQLIERINNAKESIYVQAYSFTDKDIAQALVEAAKRGLMVKILLDKSNKNDHRSAKDIIVNNNIPLRFDSPPGIAHNKILVIDNSLIITGSYNFSANAYKRNTENVLFLQNNALAQQYIENWFKRWKASTPYNK